MAFALVVTACAPPTETPDRAILTAPDAGAPENIAIPEGLTPAAADTFRRVKAAADAGDAAALVAIAAESPGFAYSFGAEDDFAAYVEAARAAGRDPVAELALILSMSPGETTLDGLRVFHWPYFYDWEAARYTPEARADAARIVGVEAAAQITDELAYLGPRAGFDENGQWLFYVTGD